MSDVKMVKTKGAAELLVKRRLGVLKDLIREYQLKMGIYTLLRLVTLYGAVYSSSIPEKN